MATRAAHARPTRVVSARVGECHLRPRDWEPHLTEQLGDETLTLGQCGSPGSRNSQPMSELLGGRGGRCLLAWQGTRGGPACRGSARVQVPSPHGHPTDGAHIS